MMRHEDRQRRTDGRRSRGARCCDRARHVLCPKGGWAEDFPHPPGLLFKYPALRETPCARPEQRTEWNVRDSDAILIIADPKGLSVSKGTRRAKECADRFGKPLLVIDVSRPDA